MPEGKVAGRKEGKGKKICNWVQEKPDFFEDGEYEKTWMFMPDKGMHDGSELFELPLKVESKYDVSGNLVAKVETIYNNKTDMDVFSISSYNVNGVTSHCGSDGGLTTGRSYLKRLPEYNNSEALITVTEGYSGAQKRNIQMLTKLTKTPNGNYKAVIFKKEKGEWHPFSMCSITKKSN